LLIYAVGARLAERDRGVSNIPGDPPNRQTAVASREPPGDLGEDATGAGIHVVRVLHRDGDVPVTAAAELLDGAAEQIYS
jgi:hypothetical protein